MRRLWLVMLVVMGCGKGTDHAMTGDDDAAVDAPDPDGWVTLMKGDWSLPPGGEGYFCVYVTAPTDIYIKAFRPIAPLGTHHTVLTRYTGASPADGTEQCNVATNGHTMIYGSGIGATDFDFPTGVGLHLAKGDRLLLNLHLFNASDNMLSGTSGVQYQSAQAADIANLAELVLAGPTVGLSVPTGISTQSGTCKVSTITSSSVQLFALSQHMHMLGTHMKSVVTRTGSPDIVLQDVDYNFEHQVFNLMPALVELQSGDVVTTNCTYDNTTMGTVPFGQSSTDEMCFTDLFYYPAQGANYICDDGF
jgi:hypothetical protein